MTPPKLGTARLTEKIQLADKFFHFYFEYIQPPTVQFEAGQYASVKVTDHGDRRSYSFCSSPDKQHGFELMVDIGPQGPGSQMFQNIQVGAEIDVLAPLGLFTINNDGSEQSLVFIATGSGVTPFRSMILDQLQNKNDKREMTLYWGMRHVDQLFWVEEFEQLAQAFPNFHFHPTVSQPLPEWSLCRGRVTDCLNNHQLPENAGFYLCGNAGMIKDVMALLEGKGVKTEHLHHEKFH